MWNICAGHVLRMKLSSTGAPTWHGSYVKTDTGGVAGHHEPLPVDGVLNGTTYVTIVPDPTAGLRNALHHFHCQMLAARTVTISMYDGATDRFVAVALDSGDIIEFDGHRFRFLTSAGAEKGSGGGGGGSITVREIDGAPTISATIIEVTNGKLSLPGGGVARLDLSGGGGSSDDAMLFAFFMAGA